MFEEFVRRQHGVLTREQAYACGLTKAQVENRIRSGRWQVLVGRIFATFTGSPPREAVLWAALLRAETVLDLTQQADNLDEALGWLARACGRRLTTADRIAKAMAGRAKLRWRAELRAALVEVAEGCHSLLELRYLRDVERAHGLPSRARQVARARRGGRWYDDVAYPPYRTRVELDSRAGHPADRRWRDARRDNAAAAEGETTLRYGWTDATENACASARQVATVLRRNGWAGHPHPCGPKCRLQEP